jgi:hypothetical protein
MGGRKKICEQSKNKRIIKDAIYHKDVDSADMLIISKIMRESRLYRTSLYIPKQTEWHRFARRSEVSQK